MRGMKELLEVQYCQNMWIYKAEMLTVASAGLGHRSWVFQTCLRLMAGDSWVKIAKTGEENVVLHWKADD